MNWSDEIPDDRDISWQDSALGVLGVMLMFFAVAWMAGCVHIVDTCNRRNEMDSFMFMMIDRVDADRKEVDCKIYSDGSVRFVWRKIP